MAKIKVGETRMEWKSSIISSRVDFPKGARLLPGLRCQNGQVIIFWLGDPDDDLKKRELHFLVKDRVYEPEENNGLLKPSRLNYIGSFTHQKTARQALHGDDAIAQEVFVFEAV